MEDAVRSLLGSKWALEILSLLAKQGPLNYAEIEEELPTSSDVIVKRLQRLSEVSLIERTEKSPRNVQYSITEDGEEVLRLTRDISTYLDK
jgi:DNA-binding HxlR family transcriptional regulator